MNFTFTLNASAVQQKQQKLLQVNIKSFDISAFDTAQIFPSAYATVNFIVFGTLHCFWDSGYLCHFSTEIAEIWSPGTFFKDVWAYKISAQNLLYFRSYKIFSGGKSEGKIGLELRELKFITKY